MTSNARSAPYNPGRMTQFQVPFLDVPSLLERSQPRRRGGWFWYAVGTFLLISLVMAWLRSQSEQMAHVVEVLSSLIMIGAIGLMSFVTWYNVQQHRNELKQVAAIEELIQLRRWQEAAGVLQGLLSRPTRTPHARIQALLYLTSVLARYHRFEDAIQVQGHLLENVQLDPGTEHGLKLGRAMAMLREDHLFDADRAIADLRRTTEGRESAGLALVEIYRDVKTGHPAEAIDIFESRLPVLRDQLGMRVSDAHVLAARAYDMLGREQEAKQAFERATLLSPLSELSRRYPEVAQLSQKYTPAAAPQGAA